MRAKVLLASLGTLLMLIACVAPSKMVRKEGDKTIVTFSGLEFTVPPGFSVVDTEKSITSDEVEDSIAVMSRSERNFYTVIIFSRQKAGPDLEFITLDLKERFPGAIFYDEKLGFIDHAATYIEKRHMARRLYLEQPLCKVLTGYRYTGSGETRFRFDVYQNLPKEDPLMACCGRDKKQRELPKELADAAIKAEIDKFRNFALALIKDNLRVP